MCSSWLSRGEAGFAVLAGFCGVNIPQTASSKPQTQHQWMRELERDEKVGSPRERAPGHHCWQGQKNIFSLSDSILFHKLLLKVLLSTWKDIGISLLTGAWEQTRTSSHLYDVCGYFRSTKLWSKAHSRRGGCPGRPARRLALGRIWECWFWESSHHPNW